MEEEKEEEEGEDCCGSHGNRTDGGEGRGGTGGTVLVPISHLCVVATMRTSFTIIKSFKSSFSTRDEARRVSDLFQDLPDSMSTLRTKRGWVGKEEE